mgnify:FL=1|tara:strand:+ start:272 stop:454 length:183 start_codon:yes stop_codon:yes gene_type:complete
MEEQEYWVHIYSHTSFIVKAESKEKAEELALEEFDTVEFDTENVINHEWDKTESKEVESD